MNRWVSNVTEVLHDKQSLMEDASLLLKVVLMCCSDGETNVKFLSRINLCGGYLNLNGLNVSEKP